MSYIIFPNVAIDFFKRRKGLLPPLELKNSCEAGKELKAISTGGNSKTESKLDELYSVDETLIWNDDDNSVYPAV